MTETRYITRRLAHARNVLSNPRATDAQRCAARRTLNRFIPILRERLARQPLFIRRIEVTRARRREVEQRAAA